MKRRSRRYPWRTFANPVGIVRLNPAIPRTRESASGRGGSAVVPLLIVAGTAAAVFGVVYYLGRRPAASTTTVGGQRLPPGAVGLNEYGYPVGADGTPMLDAAWNWPGPGVAVGTNAAGQLIDRTGSVITTTAPVTVMTPGATPPVAPSGPVSAGSNLPPIGQPTTSYGGS